MNKYVIDASAVINWLNLPGESSSPSSLAIFEQFMRGEIILITTEFLLLELVNILVQKKHFQLDEVLNMRNLLLHSPLQFFPLELIEQTDFIPLMTQYSLTVYDSLYLQLAIKENCQLITLDRDLLTVKKYAIHPKDLKN